MTVPGAIDAWYTPNQSLGKIDLSSLLQPAIEYAEKGYVVSPVGSALPNHQDTVYLTVVDAERNACSFINSVFSSWVNGLVAGNTGIILQNRGSGFSLEKSHFNRFEAVKRPMHTIIPSMVYKNDEPTLSFGVMGGQYQAMGQTYFLSNWIDYGMDVQESLDAPRFFLYNGELSLEAGIAETTRLGLAKLGHSRLKLSNRTVAGRQFLSTGARVFCTADRIPVKTEWPPDTKASLYHRASRY